MAERITFHDGSHHIHRFPWHVPDGPGESTRSWFYHKDGAWVSDWQEVFHPVHRKMYFRRRDGVRTQDKPYVYDQEHGPYVPLQATPPPPPPAPAPAPAAGALVLVSSPGHMEIDSGDDDVNSRAGDSEDDIRGFQTEEARQKAR